MQLRLELVERGYCKITFFCILLQDKRQRKLTFNMADMAAEEEEEDYMSDAFLLETETTKPGLLARKMAPSQVKKFNKEKRIREINEKHRQNNKPVKEIEKEKRDEKLNTALDSSNKGFAMLAKMGFKEGSGLGKHGRELFIFILVVVHSLIQA